MPASGPKRTQVGALRMAAFGGLSGVCCDASPRHARQANVLTVIPGRRDGGEPGIQNHMPRLHLDSGSGPFGPSRNDDGEAALFARATRSTIGTINPSP
jgi:hypothetical protein